MPNLRDLRKLVIISAVIGAMTILPYASTHVSTNRTSEEGTIKIPSQILNEERTLSIALPKDYDKSQKAYPVLYILDAEARNEFTDAISTVKDLEAEGVGPQMIIIGIWNTNRNRDMIPAAVSHRPQSGGSQKFLKFITDELKPYVKQNYRTTDFSVLYGASNAGLFSVYALLENPDAFDGIIASSPMIGHCPEHIQMKAEAFVRRDQIKNCALYMIYGTEDSQRVTAYIPDFHEFLKSKAPPGFVSQIKILKGEGHVPKSSKSRGLRYVFAQNKSLAPNGLTSKENGDSIAWQPQNPTEKSETWEWPISTPEKQQLDPEPLAELVSLIREGRRYPRLHSLLVIRHGYLVVEEYFGRFQGDTLHTLQSVTKSFTSALVGIAISRGEFKGVDEKILDFFPDMTGIANLDERKESIRLKDLLTMRSGTDYNENGPDSPHFQLNRLPRGWDKFYLDRPMLRMPGTHFLYDSGGVILMSAMLKKRTGMHADQYAEKYLFKPLQIDQKFWFRNQESHPHTGGGLNLKPRDTAKFGLLYLQKGRWGGEQIVPEAWVKESSIKRVDFGATSQTIGYGYLWWMLRPDPDGNGKDYIYAAMGFRAQYIFVIPEHDMVVVVNGDTQSRIDQRKPIEFLYTHILKSVKR
jgi:CubicO group peptidase (beta-lactamase class C family)/predicted alpha/beta superfamily hydrolase